MSTPVFGYTLPAPIAASFPPGTLGLAVASSAAGYRVSGTRTYYLGRHIQLNTGVHRLIAYADDAASVWFGNSANEVRMIGSIGLTSGPASFEFFVPRTGLYRFDIILQNIGAESNVCYAAMAIEQAGVVVYRTAPLNWLQQEAAQVPDAELQGVVDVRLVYPVFSILPNWKTGVLERVQYETEILNGETDDEQRRSIRQHSRRSFEASFMRQGPARGRLDTFLNAVGRQMVLLPLWHEQHYMTTEMPIGAPAYSFPRETLQYREFRANDLVLITNGEPNDFEVLTIASLGGYGAAADQLRFLTGPRRAWPRRTRIIPLRVAKLSEQVSISNPTDRIGIAQIRFDVMEANNQYEADWGYCVPLFQLVPNRAEELGITIDRTSFALANPAGFEESVEPGSRSLIGQRLSVMLRGRQEIVAHRKFMEAARGRARAFYMPTFTHDIEPIDSVRQGTYLDVKPAGYAELFRVPQRSRLWVAFVYREDSAPLYREIIAAEVASYQLNSARPSVERLHFRLPLPAIARERIARIMFVVPSRFDQDTFEISHPTDDSRVAVASLVTKSVDQNLGDIDCWVTSKPYPVLASDALIPAVSIVAARMYSTTGYARDDLDVSAFIPEATLRVLLGNYYPDPEGPLTNARVMQADLRQVLKMYDTKTPETINTFGTVSGGDMKKILVTYSLDTETINSAATIVQGTLT